MIKKRSKRLEPVASHANQLEQEAARILAEAQQRVVDGEQQLQQLVMFRDEYLAKYEKNSQQIGSVSKLLDYQAFIAKLNQGIGQANRMIEVSRQQQEVLKQQWLQRRTRSQALKSVIESCQKKERLEEDKKEQLSLEELTRQRLYMAHS